MVGKAFLSEILLQPLLEFHNESFLLSTVEIHQAGLTSIAITTIIVAIEMLDEVLDMNPMKLGSRVHKQFETADFYTVDGHIMDADIGFDLSLDQGIHYSIKCCYKLLKELLYLIFGIVLA